MMMAQKKHFLHELLSEDQEPFLLTNYISEKQSQLKKKRPNSPNTALQLKKQKPLIQHQTSTFFPVNLCKNACFLSFHNSTTTRDITKSPLFQLSSPHKSPCSSPNTIFLHVPARTASMLVEAALRIQEHSKTKTHNKSNGFGLLGSLFKRLTQRSKKRQIEDPKENVKKVKDILRFEFDSHSVERRRRKEEKEEKKKKGCSKKDNNDDDEVVVEGSCEVGFRCSCRAVWSESNEDNKSMDMETSSSGHYSCDCFEEEEVHQFVGKQKENAKQCCACFVDDDDDNNRFLCESPFRFVLQRSLSSSSSGRRTPEFSSPASSPSRLRTEDKESNNGADSINNFQSGEEEEKEDKEQCSPVSVLDPPFEDDDDVHENDYEEGGSDLESSYANVQRTKQQLLYRLSRFEKLAELDPLELEKSMLDHEDKEYGTFIEDDGCEDGDSKTSCEEKDLREIVYAILSQPSIHERRQVPEDLKRLVSDLIMEEEIRELDSSEDRDMVMTRVCRRLELWKEVESNTIDMMIDEDFSREEGGWKKNAQQVRELARELELAIFGFLVEEFLEELGLGC